MISFPFAPYSWKSSEVAGTEDPLRGAIRRFIPFGVTDVQMSTYNSPVVPQGQWRINKILIVQFIRNGVTATDGTVRVAEFGPGAQYVQFKLNGIKFYALNPASCIVGCKHIKKKEISNFLSRPTRQA